MREKNWDDTNAHFESIDEYKDVEALDIFRDFYGKEKFSEKIHWNFSA